MVDSPDFSRCFLGIELGSTRIKACLINHRFETLASGAYRWESQFEDGHWTYPLELVLAGVQAATSELWAEFGMVPQTLGGIGVSAMMHGYLAFDRDWNLLVPFRTWKDTSTDAAAKHLSEVLGINIPLRWSLSHLYQAALNREPHLGNLRYLTTLAGYVHHELTGQHLLGVGDASGMFPLAGSDYDTDAATRVDQLLADQGVQLGNDSHKVLELLPQIRTAGQDAGTLTARGATLLDPTGTLSPGIVVCPPEGDAGTGMVATGAVNPGTGNLSVGTSIFSMVVLPENNLVPNPNVDIVATPAGHPVAMVHCNNGAAELDHWAQMFIQFAHRAGFEIPVDQVFSTLLEAALAATGTGGLVTSNTAAAEPVLGVQCDGAAVTFPDFSGLELGAFFKAQLFSVFAALNEGFLQLRQQGVEVDFLAAHGGIFRTPVVAQRTLASILEVPVTVNTEGAEGGAWGMAVLAAFAGGDNAAQSLGDFLRKQVFSEMQTMTELPDQRLSAEYQTYRRHYLQAVRALTAGDSAK